MNKANTSKNTDTIKKVYLFSGEADSRREAAVNKIIEQAINPDWAVFDLQKFDGDSAVPEDIMVAAATVPFGSPKKVVIVYSVDKLNADAQSRLASFIPKQCEHACLILLANESGEGKRKPASSTKNVDSEAEGAKTKKGLRSELSAKVKEHGSVIKFPKLKSKELISLIKENISASVSALGKRIEPGALETLARALEGNPASIEREVEKLATYACERDVITLSDVKFLIPIPPSDRVFALIDAVSAGRSDLAIEHLNDTLAYTTKQLEEILKALSLLARHFRMLYQVKFLMDEGRVRSLRFVPEELQALLPIEQNPLSMSDWQQNKLMDQARLFSIEELQQCLRLILNCELAIKGQGKAVGSPRLNLEMLIMKLSQRKSVKLI